MFNNFCRFIKTNKFSLLEKKFFIDLTCVSPIPSISSNSSKFLLVDKLIKFPHVLKYFAKIFAFSYPICLIPNSYINFSN